MQASERPQVLVIGTSHAITLKQGLDLMGIPAALIWANGIVWDQHSITVGGIYGIRAASRPRVGHQIRNFFRSLDVDHLRNLRIPVIGAMGFAIGTISPRMHASGNLIYGVDAPSGSDPDDMTILSRDFTDVFLRERRWSAIGVIEAIADATSLTLITDPYESAVTGPDYVNYDTIEDILSGWYEASGAKVFRTRDYMVDPISGYVPSDLIVDAHGTPDYGRLAIERMIDEGYLRL